ncbi:MAG: pilus assembly protein TadG-related protein [Armatimonadetes bacterium]|nr:pilus assembly protein TadG-related protein [Armatimonadota bacterium]
MRRRRLHNSFSRQRGAVVGLFAVAALILIAAMAACVDVGMLVLARLRMQNAADLAATTAAALTDQLDDPDVWYRAASYYAYNLYGVDASAPTPEFLNTVYDPNNPAVAAGATYRVGRNTVTVRHPYRDSVTNARGYLPQFLVRVDARVDVRTPLMSVLGVAQAPVAVGAVALGEPSGPCLVFAASTNPNENGIDISSNGGRFLGDIHSNTKVDNTGSDHYFDGWIDYRYSYRTTGSGHVFVKGFRLGNVLPYPRTWTLQELDPYITHRINGNLKFTSHVIPAGVYYVRGNVNIGSDDVPTGPVTFIAEGRIQVNGGGHNFRCAVPDLLFMSLSTSDRAIDTSAQGGVWEGVFFAPNGNIKFSASGQHIYRGGLEAMTIQISGQNFICEGRLPPLPRMYSRLVR